MFIGKTAMHGDLDCGACDVGYNRMEIAVRQYENSRHAVRTVLNTRDEF